MSRTIQCDKCGKILGDLEVVRLVVTRTENKTFLWERDLCDTCQHLVREFIEGE